jgi:hypothetical protein
MAINPSITTWNRVEPRPRVPKVKASLRAEIRDPAWLLGRQWQLGEFAGEDAGSPAFADLSYRVAELRQWTVGTVSAAFNDKAPLERQALAELHSPDQATRVELGQVFFRILDDRYAPQAIPQVVKDAFKQAAPIQEEKGTEFNALEESTRQFQLVVLTRAADGVEILTLAQAGTVPDGIDDQNDKDKVGLAYPDFIAWVKRVFGAIGTDPPAAWDPQRLENRLTITAGPADAPSAVLAVQPDADGRLEWSSFELASQSSDPFAGTIPEPALRVAPTHVRFPGMPANRFWDFEEGELAFPDIDIEKRDLQKLLVVDFALIHGVDWFVLPLELPVGKIVRIDSLVVRDVFGGRTTVERADEVGKPPGTTRWTIFSVAQPGAGLASFTIVPPSAGPGVLVGPIVEDVRFARDEMANMAWAIERATEGRLGEPRPGSERDAAADAATPAPPPGTVSPTVPLKYQIESKVPLNWIPLVGVPDPARPPAIQLQKARVLRPGADKQPAAVPPIGKILKPEPYFLPEEEIPRAGLRVERVVFRARWTDGSAHLWVARRRRGGAGETQSGLRFDAALPNKS